MTSILKVSEIQDPTNGNTALSIDSSGRIHKSGLVLQVKEGQGLSSSGNYATGGAFAEVDSAMRVTLTPHDANSKFYAFLQVPARLGTTGARLGVGLYRKIGSGSFSSIHRFPEMLSNGTNDHQNIVSLAVMDSPSTTSDVTYTVYAATHNSNTATKDLGNYTSAQGGKAARLFVMEIAG